MSDLNEQLAALKAAAGAATPGPWTVGDDETSSLLLVGPEFSPNLVCNPVISLHSHSDACFIAAANPATILALIAEVEAARRAPAAAPAPVAAIPDLHKLAVKRCDEWDEAGDDLQENNWYKFDGAGLALFAADLRAALAAPAAAPAPAASELQTDLAKRLLDMAEQTGGRFGAISVLKAELVAICCEANRYYTGMMDWKRAAEAKDAALAAVPAAAPIVQPVGAIKSTEERLAECKNFMWDSEQIRVRDEEIAELRAALAAPVVQAEPVANGLVEAGALRQFRHNDGSEGFVFAYDMKIVDREFARLAAPTTTAADAKDAALRIIDAHLAEYNESALGYEEAAAFNELESVRADIAAIATSADEVKS